ncbi:MAG: hypothetical protein RMJ56_07705 [Gemmataceae bacterium]|nr:hypothetical protein [Gemmata sp.]MDW8197476.1 hypothetical protein [Gemmataceae bacterium]
MSAQWGHRALCLLFAVVLFFAVVLKSPLCCGSEVTAVFVTPIAVGVALSCSVLYCGSEVTAVAPLKLHNTTARCAFSAVILQVSSDFEGFLSGGTAEGTE